MDSFWSKVRRFKRPGSCWVWTGGMDSDGYGSFHIPDGGTIGAHKYSYMLAHPGEVIKEGICILHSCDNRPCVNPEHMFLGTNLDNIKDKVFKGRGIGGGGTCHGNAKITWAKVNNIRATYSGKYGEFKSLCKRYNIKKSHLRSILSFRTWKKKNDETGSD